MAARGPAPESGRRRCPLCAGGGGDGTGSDGSTGTGTSPSTGADPATTGTGETGTGALPTSTGDDGTPTPGAPLEGYDDPALWLCHPDKPVADDAGLSADLTATELLADGGTAIVEHTSAAAPAFDCFYV